MSEIEADRAGYPRLEEQLALVDCSLPESEVRNRWPALAEYLQSGADAGLDTGYLLSRRRPWYAQEQRPPALFLCTYMGRGAGETKPFRFFWNKSRATAPNVYLMLYPIGPLASALRAAPNLAQRVFAFLQAISPEMLRNGGRVYGGALHKVEPKELANLPAQELADQLGLESERDPELPLFATVAAPRRHVTRPA